MQVLFHDAAGEAVHKDGTGIAVLLLRSRLTDTPARPVVAAGACVVTATTTAATAATAATPVAFVGVGLAALAAVGTGRKVVEPTLATRPVTGAATATVASTAATVATAVAATTVATTTIAAAVAAASTTIASATVTTAGPIGRTAAAWRT